MTKTLSAEDYKKELIETAAEMLQELDWFQVQEILENIETLAKNYCRV